MGLVSVRVREMWDIVARSVISNNNSLLPKRALVRKTGTNGVGVRERWGIVARSVLSNYYYLGEH